MAGIYIGKIGIDFELPENGIFVFGSNTQGRHGMGAAKIAKDKYGAVYGQAYGLQGRSYAIVTKDLSSESHPSVRTTKIITQIRDLYSYADQNPNKKFYIAYGIGKNLNGYSSIEMSKMFSFFGFIPENIVFDRNFYELVEREMYIQNLLKRNKND